MKRGFLWEQKNVNWFILPVVLFLSVISFVIRATDHFLHGELRYLFGTNYKTELFTRYRSYALLGFAALMLLLLVIFCKRFFSRMDRRDWFILAAVGLSVVCIVLSTVFSEHQDTALWGMFDRAEGLLTQISYLVLFLYTAVCYRGEKDFKAVMAAFGIVIAFNGVMSVFQYFGHDPMSFDWVGKLVIPKRIGGSVAPSSGGRMYGVADHYNFLGSVSATLFPVCAVLALFEKKLWQKLLYACGAVLSVIMLLGSTSRAGLIGAFFAVLFSVFFLRRYILRYWKIAAAVAVVFLVGSIGLNAVLDNSLYERVPQMLADVKTLFTDMSDFDYKDHLPLRGVENVGNTAVIQTQDGKLILSVEDGQFTFRDGEGQPVVYKENADGLLVTQHPSYRRLNFRLVNSHYGATFYTYARLIYNGYQVLQFYYDDAQVYLAQKNTIEPMELVEAASVPFLNGKERIGSSRGYIWSRTIPLLPNYLLWGAGPDCFIYEFPQDDALGKLYAYGQSGMVVDKPHNLYLQIFVNHGGVALLAFLAICGVYLYDCVKLYGRDLRHPGQFRGVAVCLGVVGYLFAGLFNDSTVYTAILFWILLGIGFGVNREYRRERSGGQ